MSSSLSSRESDSHTDYCTVDEAISDGWTIILAPGGHWWGSLEHRYHATAKKNNYHVELAANSLHDLKRALRMLKSVPRADLPYTREWWRREAIKNHNRR